MNSSISSASLSPSSSACSAFSAKKVQHCSNASSPPGVTSAPIASFSFILTSSSCMRYRLCLSSSCRDWIFCCFCFITWYLDWTSMVVASEEADGVRGSVGSVEGCDCSGTLRLRSSSLLSSCSSFSGCSWMVPSLRRVSESSSSSP